jgi:cell shape-determining protein MreC
MKTIYHSRNSRSRNRKIVGAIVVVVIVAALVVSGLLSRTFYKGMVFLSGSTAGAGQVASSFSGLFSSKIALKKENDILKQKLAENEVALSDRDILIKQNADLNASIHYKVETGNVAARVMSKPPFTPFDVMVVDAGELQGVEVGDRVMIGQTYLGTITLVSTNSSQVTLLSSPFAKNESFIGDDALPVVLNGKGGGNFETSLPQGSNVKEGDLVFTYYLQTPLLIGKVSKVITDEDNTVMKVLMTVPFNLYAISHVEIIST